MSFWDFNCDSIYSQSSATIGCVQNVVMVLVLAILKRLLRIWFEDILAHLRLTLRSDINSK